MIKSKNDLKNKYLKQKKKHQEDDLHFEKPNFDDSFANSEKDSKESFDADNLPVFVETEESKRIDDLEKKRAYEAFLGRPVVKESKQQAGTWKTVDASLGKREIPKVDQKKKGSDDSSSDSESSSEVAPRRRHDSSESDIDINSEERNNQKAARNQAFKEQLIKALGMEPEKEKQESSKDSDIEIDSEAEQNDKKNKDQEENDLLKKVG